MKTDNRFIYPAVEVRRNDDGLLLACAAMRVRSFLSPLLRELDEQEKDRGIMDNFRRHLSLCMALAQWPGNTLLSLNMVTRPNPDFPMEGRIETSLVVTVCGDNDNRDALIAEVLARHSALAALLLNFLPEVEIQPVHEENELADILHPFTPAEVMAIGRRHENLTISRPRETGQAGIGFLRADDCRRGQSRDATVIPYCFPWTHPDPKQGNLALLTDALLATPSPLWYQVRLRPCATGTAILAEKRESMQTCEKLLADIHAETLCTVQLRALRDALAERIQELGAKSFEAMAFLSSTAAIDEALAGAAAAVIAPEPSAARESKISLFGGCRITAGRPENFADPVFFPEKEPCAPSELASMFRLPYPLQRDICGLPIRDHRTTWARPDLLKNSPVDGLLLGDNVHRGFSREIRLGIEDRMRHCCIFGQTGTGKSTLMANMVVQDIENGFGLCLIDPHGDLVAEVMNRYPEHRRDDLVLIDMLDTEHVMPMNLLAWQQPDERDFLIDSLYTWLDKAYNMRETGGPMFELYFRTFLRVVMGDEPRKKWTPTINDFMRIFNDRQFRRFCESTITDEQVRHMMSQARNVCFS